MENHKKSPETSKKMIQNVKILVFGGSLLVLKASNLGKKRYRKKA